MRIRTRNTFTTIRTEGAILPPDLLQRIADGDRGVPGLRAEDYHVEAGRKLNEVINEAWNRLLVSWARFKKDADPGVTAMPTGPTGEPAPTSTAVGRPAATIGRTGLTRERWLLPLFQQLGYGRLVAERAVEIEGKTYPISHYWHRCPIHLIGCHIDLDRRAAGVAGAARTSPHSLVQEYLNRSEEHLWGFVSNGLRLRILRDSASLTRQAFVEFDVQAMMDGEVYADFVVLWLLCHQSRVEAERPEHCWLEKWSKLAHDEGTRALDALRDGVQAAIEALGRGFLAHSQNRSLKDMLQSGQLNAQDYYRQLLRLVYRLLFLFVAEDRGLLLDPNADAAARDRYTRFYSTARLRTLAGRRRGTGHHDLFVALRLVMGKLGHTGCPELGLPALGSFLWSDEAVRQIIDCEIANTDLLDAIRALAHTQHQGVLRPVDYKNLGPEELGSVYESLLELHPEINVSAGTFALRTAAGHERKTTGSYYTPTSLINCLLDSALDPVVADRLKEAAAQLGNGKRAAAPPDAVRAAQERAILSLKVCDPACGSGHFLIAAAHRLAKRLAAIRTGDDEPAPEAVRHALRDVIGHCIYGVDINPMAVELCKVALWMEALEPGKPLSFLDHRIQCGNSLLGVTPALLAKGIPDEAFKPIEGDDKEFCKELKRRNRDERRGGHLFDMAGPPWERLGNIATALVALDSIADDTLAGVQDKQRRWQELVQSSGYLSGRLLADAWCAAFVWKKTREMDDAITESVFRRIERNPHSLTPWMRDEIKRLAAQYKFFHWHLAFPDVFRVPGPDDEPENEQAGWLGGFDVVLGNPPWERIKLQEKEWFAERRPDIAGAPNAARRRRMIAELGDEDPALYQAFLDDRRQSEGESMLVRGTGRYPLCGRGDVNTYALFAELNRSLINLVGRVGCIVPSGIATDETTRFYFEEITQRRSLFSLLDFENRDGIFPGVHRSYKFSLLTLTGSDRPTTEAQFAFFVHDVADLREEERQFTLSPEDILLLNPNTRTCPIFRSKRDTEITKYLHTRLPVLVRERSDGQPEQNPWGITFLRMFDMTNDSSLFSTREELEASGWTPNGNVLVRSDDVRLSVWEGKMTSMWDHRAAHIEFCADNPFRQQQTRLFSPNEHSDPFAAPRAFLWGAPTDVAERTPDAWGYKWFPVFKRVTAVTNERTLLGCVVPLTPVSYTLYTIICTDANAPLVAGLLATICSFAADYSVRQKTAQPSLPMGVVYESVFPPPNELRKSCLWDSSISGANWMSPRAIELTFAAWDVQAFAHDCGYIGPPFRWDKERRFVIRCELDAAFFHLYLGTPQEWRQTGSPELLGYFPTPRDAVEYIMETFPIVKRKDEARYGSFRTKETILSIYDEMAEAIAANEAAVAAGRQPTAAYRTRLDPPAGPTADAAGNFLPLPEWKPGQPRPADWPPHIHAPREVHEWALANGIDWRELHTTPPGVLPVPARRPAAAQVQRGRAVAFTTLLLHTWNKPVGREVLEPALILMLNDGIRQAVLGKQTPKTESSEVVAAIVTGFDHFLQGLQANGVVDLQAAKGRQVLKAGPQAVSLDRFPDGDKTRANETIQAINIIGESKAMTFVKAMLDEAGQSVPTFAAD